MKQLIKPDKLGVRRSYPSRVFLAEFLGTVIMVFLGDATILSVVIGRYVVGINEKTGEPDPTNHSFQFYGDWQSCALAYGAAVMVGMLIAGGVSGGHLNPAITLATFAIGRMERKSPGLLFVYFTAQFLGAAVGGAIAFALHVDNIHHFDKHAPYKSAIGLTTLPTDDRFDMVNLFFEQLVATMLLQIVYLAATDTKKSGWCVSQAGAPLTVGIAVTGVMLSSGIYSYSALNPARDFSPRVLCAIAGYGREIWTDGPYFFLIPFFVPYLGCLLGACLHYVFIGFFQEPDPPPKESVETEQILDLTQKIAQIKQIVLTELKPPALTDSSIFPEPRDAGAFVKPGMIEEENRRVERLNQKWEENYRYGRKGGRGNVYDDPDMPDGNRNLSFRSRSSR